MLYKIRCNPVHPFIVLYLDHMCQCGLHAVLWSHIGTLMHRLAAEPRSTARLLFTSRCPSGTIFLTQYSMVRDWRVSRAGPMLFYRPKLLYPYNILLLFSISFLSVYRLVLWAGVFGLIWCISLSPSLALLTFFNNNNNRVKYPHFKVIGVLLGYRGRIFKTLYKLRSSQLIS